MNPDKKADTTIDSTKVISLSWVKYAVAACVIFGIGIIFWQNNTNEIQPNSNTVVTTEKDTTKFIKPNLTEEPIDAIVYQTKTIEKVALTSSDLGFAPANENSKIKIIIKDGTKEIIKLETFLKDKQKKSTLNETKQKAIKNQLTELKQNIGKYSFFENTLTLYSNTNVEPIILSTEIKKYFLKLNNQYYHLSFSKKPIYLEEVTSSEILDQLEKISFENE